MTGVVEGGRSDGARPLGLILLVVGVILLVGIRVYYGIRTSRGLGTPQEMTEFVIVAASSVATLVALGTLLSYKENELGKLSNHLAPLVIGLLVSLVYSAFAVLKGFGVS